MFIISIDCEFEGLTYNKLTSFLNKLIGIFSIVWLIWTYAKNI